MSKKAVVSAWPLGAFLVLVVSVGLAAAASPADWLTGDGKDADWVKATAVCRESLKKLDPAAAVVKRWLPAVRARCDVLRRLAKIGALEKAIYLQTTEAMLADLVKGAGPLKGFAGQTVPFGYWSAAAGKLTGVRLQVPPDYDPQKEYQLFMYYKMGGGLYWKKDGKFVGPGAEGAVFMAPWRPSAKMCRKTPETFHAWSSLYYGVKGRMGVDAELREMTAAVCRDFAVSADRIFLSGFSDGGFTSLWLASRYPHLLAGIAPEVANWQYSNVHQIGQYNVPMLVVDGWTDGGFVQRNFTRFHTLHTMGYDVAGIWGQHGHATKPYEDETEFKKIVAWAKTKRRNLHPKRVRYATWDITWHRAYWFSIERIAEPYLPAQIDAEIKPGNRIEVKTWNVAAYKLLLDGELLDPAKKVTVVTNGNRSYAGPFKAELAVELSPPPKGKFVKDARHPGDITTQIALSTYDSKGYLKNATRPWLWVKPTGGDARTRALLAKWWPASAIPDGKLDAKTIARCNLFVFGGPDVNKFTARIATDLPVAFGAGKFTIGKEVYDRPAQAVKFIHPNPLNPDRYVIVYAFNDAAAFAAKGFYGTRRESSWGFRGADCVVMGLAPRPRRWGVGLRGPVTRRLIVFGADWRAPSAEAVGELEKPFDYTQILRLRADAIREATGADVAILFGYEPSYTRWRDDLPAGGVTMHDLATIDTFPEYVTLGEATGAALKGLLARAPVSTALADPRDPTRDAKTSVVTGKIDPKKTYSLAMGYRGLPSYGVNYKKMPKVFTFASPGEFLAAKHTSLPVRNMRQVPLSMAEAVAKYVRKRKKVAPRPTCFDLTQYLMNPRANAFGACDWLHLGADVALPGPKPGQVHRKRYTLSLGLRAAGAPAVAAPREKSKHFLDVDMTGQGKPATFEFKMLGRQLAVKATIAVSRLAIAADAACKTFRLADDGAAGVVARAVLMDVRLVNGGAKDVTAVAALCPTAMRRIHGSTWPARERGKPAPKAYYVGFRQAVGPRKKPPVYQDAALFVAEDQAPAVTKHAARNVGYNFGLVGVSRQVTIKAGATASAPLLFIVADKPAQATSLDLAAALTAIKGDVITRLTKKR